MRSNRFATLSVCLVIGLAVRDWVGAFLYGLEPSIASAVLRGLDGLYLLFYALAIWSVVVDQSFSRLQRGLAICLQVCLLAALALTREPMLLFRSIREMVFPVAFVIAGVVMARFPSERLDTLAARALLSVLAVAIAVGVIQVLTVTSVEEYWFFKHLSNTGEMFDDFNYFRDGGARGTGLGFSPFSLAYLGLGAALYAAVRLRPGERDETRTSEKLRYGILLGAGILACIVSRSRLALVTSMVVPIAMRLRIRPWLGAMAIALLVAGAGTSLFDGVEDTSVLGRVDQWGGAALEGILTHPFGASIPTGPLGIWFDSYVLNFIVSFGYISLLAVVILIASFAGDAIRKSSTFAVVAAIVGQSVLQALEYTAFLPLALLSLGLLYGYTRRRMEPK